MIPSPVLYELFTRLWLDDLSRAAGHPVELGTVPDAEIERIAGLGFDHLWLMGVWTLGKVGPVLSREILELRADYDRGLPDWTPADVVGSPYAIARYTVDPALGGDDGLASLRAPLDARGIGLVL